MSIRRRTVLQGLGAIAASAALPKMTMAQAAKRITVTTYAGNFDTGMRKFFLPIVEKKGIEVDWVLGAAQQWQSQIDANPAKPPIDVLLVSPAVMLEAARKGAYDKITVDKVPNLKDVPQLFLDVADGYGVVFDWGTHAITYHKARVKKPPASIKEFVQRTIAGDWHAALPGIGYSFAPVVLIWRFNEILGGTLDNITPFVEAMKAMKKSGNLVTWNSLPDFINLLQTGDADIGYYPSGQSWALYDRGADWVGVSFPSEGNILNPVVACKPKNAKPEAWDFIDASLDPAAEAQFADLLSYGMGNSKVVYPDRVKDRIPDWKTAINPPLDEITKRVPQWVERWNKEIGG